MATKTEVEQYFESALGRLSGDAFTRVRVLYLLQLGAYALVSSGQGKNLSPDHLVKTSVSDIVSLGERVADIDAWLQAAKASRQMMEAAKQFRDEVPGGPDA